MPGRGFATMSADDTPTIVVIAGPNGAGKSTTAPRLLRGPLAVSEFVNADVIAQGLSAFRPESVAMAAGRAMLLRLRELAKGRSSFAFETTLASRTFAPWLKRLQADGYLVHLLFLALQSADLAVARVAERVRKGGHDVPEAVIRRRYQLGLENLGTLYQPFVDSWQVLDNGDIAGPRLLAKGDKGGRTLIFDADSWQNLTNGR
jgi:predicted ABC-type ATPase